MCGRTAVILGADRLRRACAYLDNQGRERHPEWKNADKYSPSYNKSPQSYSPVLLSLQHFEKDAESSERVLVAMRWGLVPAWFKESDPSKMQYKTSNCRSDTLMEKVSYKFNKPAAEEEEEHSKGRRLLTMAGIFDCWEPLDGGEALYSYTIITVYASKVVSFIHQRQGIRTWRSKALPASLKFALFNDQHLNSKNLHWVASFLGFMMPAILDGDEAVRKWLDFGEVPTQEALKLIHSSENLAFHPVSTIVNNSRNNTPECIVPIQLDLKKDAKASASSKMMLNWLKNESPKKEYDDDGLPRWSSQFIKAETPKKTSTSLMYQWLKQEDGEPSAKQPRNQ
ncbi:Abasic site processing protein HMCES [Varanus komodoensis]|nr:Abasic site processing protein HMCES [Varanus komodoensis]